MKKYIYALFFSILSIIVMPVIFHFLEIKDSQFFMGWVSSGIFYSIYYSLEKKEKEDK
jgi:hypothetical protein